MATPDHNSDAWLDAQLRAVPLPEGLLGRLKGVAAMSDGELDAALRDVPLPALFLWRLRQIIEAPTRLVRLGRWATAASVFLAIGLSYVGAMLLVLGSIYHAPGSPQPSFAPYVTVDMGAELAVNLPDFGPARPRPGAKTPDSLHPAQAAVTVPKIALADLDAHRKSLPPLYALPFGSSPGSLDPLLEVDTGRWPLVVGHQAFDDLPELKRVPGFAPRGIDLPVVRGVDLVFFSAYGVNPLIFPAGHPAACVSRVPLAIDTSSYELARRYLEDGMLPPRRELRTEEFLAAVDYVFPRPKKGKAMALFAAGGPSPFRGGDLKLLQFGVQAAQVPDKHRDGTRLTLAVDVSASMQWGGRLETVRRALARWAGRMGASDRVSLVVFNERASVVGEDLARDEMDQLLKVFPDIAAKGSTNVGAGLRAAYAVAGRYAGTDKRSARVMLLTDGLWELDGGTSRVIAERLAEAAARGIPLDAVDLGQQKEERPDEQLVHFATEGGGKAYWAATGEQVCWALLEAATGQSQLVASEARLRVMFNPLTVRVYRLLGHEAKAIAGLPAAHPEADFRAGQSAVALYELQLLPGGGNDVAVAELTWSDPRTGQARTVLRKFQRSEFAPTVARSALELQEAMVVSRAAEVLRDTPFAHIPNEAGGLGGVLGLARQLDTRLFDRPSFRDFVSVVEQAVKARPYRSGGHK